MSKKLTESDEQIEKVKAHILTLLRLATASTTYDAVAENIIEKFPDLASVDLQLIFIAVCAENDARHMVMKGNTYYWLKPAKKPPEKNSKWKPKTDGLYWQVIQVINLHFFEPLFFKDAVRFIDGHLPASKNSIKTSLLGIYQGQYAQFIEIGEALGDDGEMHKTWGPKK